MKFSEAFELMKQGHKLKLPSWGGYWYWDGKNQTIMMKCRAVDSDTGKELLDIRETQRVEYTLKNIMSDDWVLATNENCTVLGGQPVFDFDEAIKYIKRGLKLRRKAWECKEQYVQLTKNVSDILDGRVIYNYRDDINYDSISRVGMNVIKINWTPEYEDMFAEDWCFAGEENEKDKT